MFAPPTDQPFIELRSLSRTFPVGSVEVHALKRIDLQVARGEFLAINGVSGSGKSTLLHLLGGLDTPNSGQVIVDGRDLGAMSRRDRVLYRRSGE